MKIGKTMFIITTIQKNWTGHDRTIRKIGRDMTEQSEKLKRLALTHSNKLADLGQEMSKLQFNYKIAENTTEEYWQKRINEFKKYNEKGIQYFTEACSLMSLIDKEQSGLFLLNISKLRHMGLKLTTNMEKIKENPSIIKSKDRQQSKWSKEIREEMIEISNKCKQHEIEMNRSFRIFYEEKLKKIL